MNPPRGEGTDFPIECGLGMTNVTRIVLDLATALVSPRPADVDNKACALIPIRPLVLLCNVP